MFQSRDGGQIAERAGGKLERNYVEVSQLGS